MAISEKDAQRLAAEITDDLFRNGSGDEAIRLVLELKGGRYGGGWARIVVRERILSRLMRTTTEAR